MILPASVERAHRCSDVDEHGDVANSIFEWWTHIWLSQVSPPCPMTNVEHAFVCHSGVAGPSFGPSHNAPGGMLQDVLQCGDGANKTCDGSTTSLAVGAFIAGAMVTNVLGQHLLNVLGRRRSAVLAATLALVGSGVTLFAGSLITFVLLRAVTGGMRRD